jgi:excinuclease ABC subunit B
MLEEVRRRNQAAERTLIITLTKKSAEDLTDFLKQAGLKVLYIHSDTESLKRMEILKKLRQGNIDVLVGINLLREGLDLPEVSLILILDADKEGFLRNRRTLIQVVGRAARNQNGKVILYADKVTKSMAETMKEVDRRRKIQENFNRENRIIPKTIVKDIRDSIRLLPDEASLGAPETREESLTSITSHGDIAQLEAEMHAAADNLDFERAAQIRDRIKALENAK